MPEAKKESLIELLKDMVKNAEEGKTLSSEGLKKLCNLCIGSMEKYKEQNRYGLAFEVVTKQRVPADILKLIKEDTERLLKMHDEFGPKFDEVEKAINTTLAYNPDEGSISFESKEEKAYAISYMLLKENYLVWDATKEGKYAIEYKKRSKNDRV